ncbi:Mu transposase C-terminal domain-containing protein [Plantactinospora sp. B6F1]|uniref:Mu transposase C-terminal domain-containing protein n=1 Tax=Plantactinospora sp. B6F1 TaxID=3158971 RepID=UPI0032D91AEC
MSGEDYLELLPVEWRRITDEGIQIGNRTYNTAALGPYRHQHSGVIAKRGRWEVHYDPYDVSQVHVRTPDGWITAAWTHLPMVSAPFADFTWRHARRLAGTGATETDVARVLDELLTRAERPDRASARITARTRAGQAGHRPTLPEPAAAPAVNESDRPDAEIIPFGVFDVETEAERWI